jgi:hypothetical protein
MRTFNRIFAGLGAVMATALPASAAMAAPADVVRVGIINGYISTCTDELVNIEGRYQEVIHPNADGSWSGHVTIQATAVGDKGNVYVIKDNAWTKVNADGSLSAQDQFRMISRGSAQNMLAFVGLTISASGDFELTTDRTACTG